METNEVIKILKHMKEIQKACINNIQHKRWKDSEKAMTAIKHVKRIVALNKAIEALEAKARVEKLLTTEKT